MDSVKTEFQFDWVEYCVVAAMLLLSTLVGVYYTFFKKQQTYNEYMLGDRSMGVFPVAMSIVASFMSGITILGIPTEIYLYGTQHALSWLPAILAPTIVYIFFLPIYCKLKLSSIFEYLEMRFNDRIRTLGTLLYSLTLILFLPAVIYVPALSLNQVSGVSVYVIAPIVSAFCLFYTAFGGLKAVVWTDAVQNTFMGMKLS